jgi:diguanylate cyclase (GGDEF)-like protein
MILFGSDSATRIRVGMAALASLLMLLSAVVMNLIAQAGLAPTLPIRLWSGISVGGMLLMLGMIRSGWSRGWSDPALTMPQMLFAVASGSVGYVLADSARGIVPSVLAMILFFGTFGLDPRRMFIAGGATLGLFASAVAISAGLHDRGVGDHWLDAAYMMMTAIVLSGSLALTIGVQQMRAHQRQQKRALIKAMADIQELATRDELTGLINRRHMRELMQRELARAERSGRTMVLAQLDVDHFKRINDGYGHAAGDAALRLLAMALHRGTRESDVVARWGGEEFVLMLCESSATAAHVLLERLRADLSHLRVPELQAPGAVALTVSIGFAAHQPGDLLDATLARADKAMYRAKATGRNCVVSG